MKNFLTLVSFFMLLFSYDAWAESMMPEQYEEIAVLHIREAFVEKGIDDDLEIEIFGGEVVYPQDCQRQCKVLISDLKLNELQNKFACKMEIFEGGKLLHSTEVIGKYYALAEVFVPKVNIGKDEGISAGQLKVVKVRVNRVKPNYVVDKESLVGAQAKRSLPAGKLVSDKEIGKKILIKKGDVVTVRYQTNAMQITAKAEALSSASKGDRLDLMNVKSKKVLYGIAVDKDLVEVED